MRGATSGLLMMLAIIGSAACPGTPPEPPVEAAVDAGPSPTGPWTLPERERCLRTYAGIPQEAGTPELEALVEVSGLVPSPMGQEVLWAHADSGDGPRVYAISETGAHRGTVTLSGATFVDAEDIAAAPCPDQQGPCLWVADTGDNKLERSEVALFAIPEPELPATGAPSLNAQRYWRFAFRFPAGPVNSEALLVATDGQTAWVVEKVDAEQARLFEIADLSDESGQLQSGVIQEATDFGPFLAPGVPSIQGAQMITGADLHTSGQSVLIRTYSGLFEVQLPNSSVRDLLTAAATTITFGPFSEGQGEAIAYDATGQGIWTVSEDPDGLTPQPLHHYACE